MPLISRSEPTVPVTVQARTVAEPRAAFTVVVPIDLTVVFPPHGPLPGVTGVRDQTGPWDHAGARRTVLLSDGSRATEQITEYVDGHSFAYEVSGFTGRARHLVRGARGEWTFTPDGEGTLIRWAYEFAPRRGRRALLRCGAAALWRRSMAAGLGAAVAAVEAANV